MNFLSFINEAASGKNLHLEHLEEEIFNRGIAGARDSILFLRSLRDMLAGHTKNPITLTTKFDGAPAIFAGIHPKTHKFFVGTKGVFAKDAKLIYSEHDIKKYYSDKPGLASKLRDALTYLPQLGITGVWQGDIMFTKDLLKKTTIDGEEYLTFQPNTIVYAVPIHSPLAKSMIRAHIGVVWHTQYTGDDLPDMKASFAPNTLQLNVVPDVWYRDAQFVDASGTATFTEAETKAITELLSYAGSIFNRLDPKLLNYISQNDTIKTQIKAFNNSKIRMGVGFGIPTDHVRDLMIWVTNKKNAEILDAKKSDTRLKREQEKNELVKFYKSNFASLVMIFNMITYITAAKNMIINKLQKVKGLGTFLPTDTGFKVTAPEGFVAIDHNGTAIKLVDRLEFSKNNFNATKNWVQ